VICPDCHTQHDGACPSAATITHQPALDDAPAQTVAPVEHGHYVVEGEHARGGLGRVLVARDRRLSRTVALKELLRRTPDAEARFVAEATITAQLQHPGVVPIYEVGRQASGAPFYAMKLITGTSLQELIKRTPTFEARLALLTNVATIAEAVAYAHQQGVIHRDLKPANVMVGELGETVVVDWGLAQRLADPAPSGQVVGTPQYMPPEQARGEPLDQRADVYALGALLYHLLVGQPPYPGTSSDEVLAAVSAGAPPPLATRLPEAPPELIAIVDKAMARVPADRYPDARELAADLRRFQTGQLVSSHRYSLAELARRWLRRHRLPVAVGVLAALALTVMGAMSVRRIVAERDRAEKQRAAAEELVQFMLSDLKRQLDPIGRLDVLDGVALNVDGYYRALERVDGSLDAASLRRRALALTTLASVETSRGHAARAVTLLQTSAALTARLPVTPELLAVQAESAAESAQAEQSLGHVPEAAASIAAALGRVDAALAANPTPRALQQLRAARLRLLIARSFLERVEGKYGATLATLLEARTLGAALLAERPADVDVLDEQLTTLGRIASLETVLGKQDDAVVSAAECVRLAEATRARDPGEPRWLGAMASCYQAQVNALQVRGDFDGAFASVNGLTSARQQLAAHDPSNARWQLKLSDALDMRADLDVKKHRLDDALADVGAANRIIDAALARAPDDVQWIEGSLDALQSLNDICFLRGDHEGMVRACRLGLERAGRLAARDRANLEWQSRESSFHRMLGVALTETGHAREGIVELRAALAVDARVSAARPDNTDYAVKVAHDHLMLGDAEQSLHDAHALLEYRAAQPLLEALMAKDPSDAQNPGELAHALVGIGETLRSDARASRESFRRALLLLTALDNAGTLDRPRYGELYAKSQRLARAPR
jgi:tRNA A-37 threonylcarbamoyl transferase component Bud32/tetratricopeptide (TPR) repeat protein